MISQRPKAIRPAPAGPHRRFRVAIAFDSHTAITHGILGGIRRFVDEMGHWELAMPGGLESHLAEYLRDGKPHGVLALYTLPPVIRAYSSGTSVVALTSGAKMPESLKVYNDPYRTAELIIQEFAGRHFRQFAIIELPKMTPAMRDRSRAFIAKAKAAEIAVWRYRPQAGHSETSALGRWLLQQPKPLGVWAIDDTCGWQVLQACKSAQLSVPEDVAVIGYKNDEPLCEFCDPPLSSIDIDQGRIGYEASALLHRLMQGELPPKRPIRIPPRGVVLRASSEALAIHDPIVKDGCEFIRIHLADGITQSEVIDHLPASPSTVLRRFKEILGRTPKQEIARLRMELARQYLGSSDQGLAEIADALGYRYLSQFCREFKRDVGMTPTQFRQSRRAKLFPESDFGQS